MDNVDVSTRTYDTRCRRKKRHGRIRKVKTLARMESRPHRGDAPQKARSRQGAVSPLAPPPSSWRGVAAAAVPAGMRHHWPACGRDHPACSQEHSAVPVLGGGAEQAGVELPGEATCNEGVSVTSACQSNDAERCRGACLTGFSMYICSRVAVRVQRPSRHRVEAGTRPAGCCCLEESK